LGSDGIKDVMDSFEITNVLGDVDAGIRGFVRDTGLGIQEVLDELGSPGDLHSAKAKNALLEIVLRREEDGENGEWLEDAVGALVHLAVLKRSSDDVSALAFVVDWKECGSSGRIDEVVEITFEADGQGCVIARAVEDGGRDHVAEDVVVDTDIDTVDEGDDVMVDVGNDDVKLDVGIDDVKKQDDGIDDVKLDVGIDDVKKQDDGIDELAMAPMGVTLILHVEESVCEQVIEVMNID
jgi:hypothetical protein